MTERRITRSVPFWLLFAGSALGAITNAASTPTIPTYVESVLGGGPGLSGAIVAIAAIAGMLAMPVAGSLGDRRGYRTIAIAGGSLAVVGMLAVALIPTLWGATAGRLLFGLGNAAAMTLLMTWLVAITPAGQRGRSLSVYGLSVWIGLAIGPQLSTLVLEWSSPATVFVVCAVLEALTVALIALLPRPRPVPTTTASIPVVDGAGRVRVVLRTLGAVWVPGVVAAAAWCGEGLMLAFLIVHLQDQGVPAAGLFGAASVFGVFAVSVILARIALASMPDRIGPLRAAAISLVALCAGLTVLALAGSFAVAAIGAALMGIGFSPLYPSLTMLAARNLRTSNRALGLGLFGSFTSVGYAGGALLGGAVLAVASSMWAFLLVAGLQLVALAIVVIFTPDDSPRPSAEAR